MAAADDLKGVLAALGSNGVSVSLTGASGMWSDFNEANKEAMLKSELISWPVTLAILVVAFGSLVAAGLPLMLTILGLVATAGLLWILTHGFDISIWAMNFALMFALALGIDYALFVVHRFRGAFFGAGLPVRDAVAVTMDTAGKAVLFSGVTVLVSLSAVMLVPSPAFRSMALGIMLSVVFVLLATLTLLPAVLAKLGPKVDALALRWVHTGEHRSPAFARWGERLWRRPLPSGPPRSSFSSHSRCPCSGSNGDAVDQGRPAATPHASATSRCSRRSGGRARGAPARRPGADAEQAAAGRRAIPASPASPRRSRARRARARPGDPDHRSVEPGGRRDDRAAARALPDSRPRRRRGGREPRPRAALAAETPLVIGVVLVLGFLLLLVALQAPLIAAVGVVTNLLAVAAAFGIGG